MAIFLKIIEMKVWENFDGLIKLRKKAFVFHLDLIINKLNANLIKIKTRQLLTGFFFIAIFEI